MKTVRFLKEFQGFLPGKTYELGLGVADVCVNHHVGVAEYVDEPQEVSDEDPETEENTLIEVTNPAQQRQLNKRAQHKRKGHKR